MRGGGGRDGGASGGVAGNNRNRVGTAGGWVGWKVGRGADEGRSTPWEAREGGEAVGSTRSTCTALTAPRIRDVCDDGTRGLNGKSQRINIGDVSAAHGSTIARRAGARVPCNLDAPVDAGGDEARRRRRHSAAGAAQRAEAEAGQDLCMGAGTAQDDEGEGEGERRHRGSHGRWVWGAGGRWGGAVGFGRWVGCNGVGWCGTRLRTGEERCIVKS